MNIKAFCVAVILPFVGIGQSDAFTVKGKIGQLNEPAKAIIRYTVDQKTIIDTVLLKEGHFEFSGTIQNPVKALLTVLHKGIPTPRAYPDFLYIYLERGVIKVTSEDSVKNAKVKGSKVNDDYEKLKKALLPTDNKLKLWRDIVHAVPVDQRKDKKIIDPILARQNEINNEVSLVNRSFIQGNSSSWVSLDLLNDYGGYCPEYNEVAPLYYSLSDELKRSADGLVYEQRLAKFKQIAMGAIAPEFSQNGVDGRPVSLSSFRGKYVLVDFWASWCGPCRAENPDVVKTYQAFKDKNFTILGVSLDQPDDRDKWIKAIADDHLEWTQVSDLQSWNNEVAKIYGIVSIPQNFLLDPSGKIIAKNLKAEGLKTKLEELIK